MDSWMDDSDEVTRQLPGLLFSAGIKKYKRDHANQVQLDQACVLQKTSGSSEMRLAGAKWILRHQLKPTGHQEWKLTTEYKLAEGLAVSSGIYLELGFQNWGEDHYVLFPGSVYRGNRFESRCIPYSPKLTDPGDIGKDRGIIISDIPRLNIHNGKSRLQERTGALAVPLVCVYDPEMGRSILILIPFRGKNGDNGIMLEENEDRSQAKLQLISPVIRETYRYTLADNTSPTTDQPVDYEAGFAEQLSIQLYVRETESLSGFFKFFFEVREKIIYHGKRRPALPFSTCLEVQEKKFNRDNWVESHGYYAVGMRENFLQDWQIGWTGGMISTYPLLYHGSELTRKRVYRNFEWLFRNGISPSGFFWDAGKEGTRWYGGDIRRAHTRNWHLVRKSGDAVFYIMKQFRLMHKLGMPPDESWQDKLRRVADSIITLWQTEGQLGQFIDSIHGGVIVGGSTSGAIVPAALAACSSFFSDPRYLETAREIAESYYRDYIAKGITCGGPGDALQCPDSESAYAMLESFVSLYEAEGHEHWLGYAIDTANQFSSWVMSWDYPFPPDTTLGKLRVSTRGSVFANAQNKHGAPGICTHSGSALLRLSRYSGDYRYASLLQDIACNIPQYLSHPGRIIPGLKPGWMSERISTTDWFEGIGEIMYGSTWAETALMLTCTELPGFFIPAAGKGLYCFENLEATRTGSKCLEIRNHTDRHIVTRILPECKLPSDLSWPENIAEYCLLVGLEPYSTHNIKLT